jgi:hypothetical protein
MPLKYSERNDEDKPDIRFLKLFIFEHLCTSLEHEYSLRGSKKAYFFLGIKFLTGKRFHLNLLVL